MAIMTPEVSILALVMSFIEYYRNKSLILRLSSFFRPRGRVSRVLSFLTFSILGQSVRRAMAIALTISWCEMLHINLYCADTGELGIFITPHGRTFLKYEVLASLPAIKVPRQR
jgi:hypothetical protein